MKKLLSIFSLILLVTLSFSATSEASNSSGGVTFSDASLSEVLEQAKAENKLVYVSFYTTWCAPCQIMKLRSYRNNDTGAYFNENFINLEINGGRDSEAVITEQYGVDFFPTLIFLRPDGTVYHQTGGFHSASDLLELGQQVLDSFSSTN